jgi:hypothetical protein
MTNATKLRTLILAILLAAGIANPAHAVIVYLKGDSQPIRGYLVEKSPERVVIMQLLTDGTKQRQEWRTSEIEDLLITLSPERLAALDPAQPQLYRNYAEELVEKRIDPEALDASLRLFLIAAHLDPEHHGRGSLLGMIGLARSETERRRFRAMLFLLDNDRNALVSTDAVAGAGRVTPQAREQLLQAIRLLRQNKKREALELAEKSNLRASLRQLTELISYEEFTEACASLCPDCQRGKQPCPRCGGSGQMEIGGRRIRCTVCRGRRTVTCEVCKGEFKTAEIDNRILQKLLRIELVLLRSGVETPVEASDKPVSEWSQALAASVPPPVRPLSLETITEFDPRQCVYLDGLWVVP